MNRDELIAQWKKEEQERFSGWDFSYLKGRLLEHDPPWSYLRRAAELMKKAYSMADLGTGGGERLLETREHWPAKVVVTEGYPPNLKLATERLGPLGVRVVSQDESETVQMPFTNGEFDLVLNRHSAINATETARILAPGGTLLTQQVHGMSGHDLMAVFGSKPQWPWATPARYCPALEAAGFSVVDLQEWNGNLTFTDVGALVYYLKAVPWTVPDFSVERHLPQLLGLQERLDSGKALSFFFGLYLIEARKRTAGQAKT